MRSLKYYILTCVFCLFFPSVFSQLKWVNPLPQGNPLKAVHFTANQNAYLAGDAGTILRSTDNGQSWTLSDSVTSNNLSSIHFTNPNLGLAGGDSGYVFKTTDAGLSWSPIKTSTNRVINDVCFMDSLTAIAVCDYGKISKSTDAGANWYDVNSSTFLHLWSLTFPGDSIGYAVGGDKGLKSVILKTYDKGETWDTLTTQIEGHLYSIFFIDELNGYAAGNYSHIIKTTDGGQTWFYSSNPNQGGNQHIRDILFTDLNTGYTVDINGNILKTINGGVSWDSLNANISSPLYTIGVNTEGTLLTAGFGGKMLKSMDEGLNWVFCSHGPTIFLVSIDFPDPNTGFITGSGGLFKTINGGQVWEYSDVTELNYAVDGHFLNANIGYVLDYNGAIFKTLDGGLSWQEQNTGERAQHYKQIFMVNAIRGYAVGGGISIGGASWALALRTVDGENWGSMPVPAGVPLFDVHFVDADKGFICGSYGKLLSTLNGGNTWHEITMDTTYTLVDIDFLSDSIGFLVGNKTNESVIFRSTDAGNSWHEFYVGSDLRNNEKINAVRFVDQINGFAIGTNGLILKTIDGGSSWYRVKKITNNLFNDIYAKSSAEGFLVGSSGTILQLEPVVGIASLPDANELTFTIFPNPTKGETTLAFHLSEKALTRIRLMDIRGREVDMLMENVLDKGIHHHKFNTLQYPNGTYIISISSLNGPLAEKLIIHH